MSPLLCLLLCTSSRCHCSAKETLPEFLSVCFHSCRKSPHRCYVTHNLLLKPPLKAQVHTTPGTLRRKRCALSSSLCVLLVTSCHLNCLANRSIARISVILRSKPPQKAQRQNHTWYLKIMSLLLHSAALSPFFHLCSARFPSASRNFKNPSLLKPMALLLLCVPLLTSALLD